MIIMSIDELIQYLRLRDFHFCGGSVGAEPAAAFIWSVDSGVVVVVKWSTEHNCYMWHVASRFISKFNTYIRFKPLLLEQDIWLDRMFDALNEQIDHLYTWLFPAHTEDL